MTVDHVTEKELADFEGRRLPPSDLLRITDHLVACADCQGRVGDRDPARRAADLRAALSGGPAPDDRGHVVDDELAGYVDGTLDPIEAELVESHLDECPACLSDVRDLQSFRAGRETAPATAAVARRRPRLRPIMAGVGLAAAAALVFILLPRLSPRSAPRDGDDSGVRIALNDDSGSVSVDAHGRWSGWPGQSSAADTRIRRVLETRRLEIPADVSQLSGARAQLRGGASGAPPSFLASPVGVVVEPDRPLFRWRPVAGAREYVVVVATVDGATLVKSPPVTTTEWTPAEPLSRGQSYVWQVTASTAGGAITAPHPPEPEARFRVLDAEGFQALEAARRATVPSHLVLGILYAEAGLLDDAQRELAALAHLNPGSTLSKDLLEDLRRRRSPQNAAPTTENAAQ